MVVCEKLKVIVLRVDNKSTLIYCWSNKMAKKKIIETVEKILLPFLKEEGYSLYHLEFLKEGRDRFLRVYIDKTEGPMGTENCEIISKYLSSELDREDPIEGNYYLEVSSPGLDRPLVTEEHFSRYNGEDIDLSLYKQIDGQKIITGTLVDADRENITIKLDGEEKIFSRKDIAKASLNVKI